MHILHTEKIQSFLCLPLLLSKIHITWLSTSMCSAWGGNVQDSGIDLLKVGIPKLSVRFWNWLCAKWEWCSQWESYITLTLSLSRTFYIPWKKLSVSVNHNINITHKNEVLVFIFLRRTLYQAFGISLLVLKLNSLFYSFDLGRVLQWRWMSFINSTILVASSLGSNFWILCQVSNAVYYFVASFPGIVALKPWWHFESAGDSRMRLLNSSIQALFRNSHFQ